MPTTRSSSSSPHFMFDRNEERSPLLRSGADHQNPSDNNHHRDSAQSYEQIMGMSGENDSSSGISSLTSRLESFRKWLTDDAKVIVHPSLCVVNGEATDGTKNAPVLVFQPQQTSTSVPTTNASNNNAGVGRIGFVDTDADRAMYDRTMGCQIRAAREIKKDEVVMTVPIPAIITPDLVAASDAGRAIAACCQRRPETTGNNSYNGQGNFWDVFENTAICEANCAQRLNRNIGNQILFKILHERKRVETAFHKAMQDATDNKNNRDNESGQGDATGNNNNNLAKQFKLSPPGLISTRAPFLAFLIHQRFSNQLDPRVISDDESYDSELQSANTAYRIRPLPESPSTFAPYARTLPSSVSLPICWKRNELALLAGCIPGMSPLQQVAARTIQLASEFIALLDAGILFRFPRTFPLGLITWERWVWAAAVFTSRTLPASCCLRAGEDKVSSLPADRLGDFQSSPEVWDELGVMIPLLDMLNHESEANQITWEQYAPSNIAHGNHNSEADVGHHPRAIVHTRVKKGAQIYTCYGHYSNQDFILQYGFAQMFNPSDELVLGWGLADAVGNVQSPAEYIPPFDDEALQMEGASLVFESADSDAVNFWWTDERLSLLEREVAQASPDSFMLELKMGKKMTCTASSDGSLHPILLAAAVVATIPTPELLKHMSRAKNDSSDSPNTALPISRSHQRILRSYLVFVFSRKLEKLLQNLDNGLKDHFSNLQLWTKVTQNGLRYKADDSKPDDAAYTGWQTFFDSHAFASTIEVEKRYYSMAPVSCVLTLYDGHLRLLQAALDGLSTWEKFESGALKRLDELGFVVLKDEDAGDHDGIATKSEGDLDVTSTTMEIGENGSSTMELQENDGDKVPDDKQQKQDGKQSPSKARRRNRKKATSGGDRPPALKLHIGNLSYTTTPSELYDYFAHVYGRENVLECHIPTERATGKSRGFGFVTMPEAVARQAAQSGRKHEIHGRFLKVAESNSAGVSNKGNRPNVVAPVVAPTDRCGNCGYRPKYCICGKPYPPGVFGGPPPPGVPPRMDRYDRGDPYDREFYHYGPGGVARIHNDMYNRSYSPPRRGSREDRDREFRRDIDRDFRYKRSDSRSDSGSRDRGRSRLERKVRGRSGSRSPPHHRSRSDLQSNKSWEYKHTRGSSRHSRSRSDSRERSRSRSRSYSNRRERRANNGEPLGETGRAGTKSRSPHADPSDVPSASKRRDSRKRSRSRSRGKSNRKRSKKDSRRHARSSSRSQSYSDGSDHE